MRSAQAMLVALLVAAASPAAAQNVAQRLTTTLSGRSYQPAYIFFTAQGSEGVLNLSRVNGRCQSTTSCTTAANCAAFPGSTCGGSPLRCQVPVDTILGQVAVIERGVFCEIAACAGVAITECSGTLCPGGQTHCGSVGSCTSCPAAQALCLCAGGATCDAADASLGVVGVPLADGFDDGSNPNHWLLQGSGIVPSLDSRLVLGPGPALPEGVSVALAGTSFRLAEGGSYVLFLKRAVEPRQTWAECFPAFYLSVFLTARSPEWCDGYVQTDCDPQDGQVWSVPGEPGNAAFSIVASVPTLAWTQPPSPGGTPAVTSYNVYAGSRSDLPNLLNNNGDSCFVAATSGLSASISGNPASGTFAWYLVRAANSCAEGAAGSASAGPRVHNARNCDDGLACTIDACDVSLGCVHTPVDAQCDDGIACTTDSCNAVSGCVHTDFSALCDDGNVCTDDSCLSGPSCAHANNTAPCDDGNACTMGETCLGGACPTATNHLVISQVQVAGDGATPADDEFVELYNPTAGSISLSGLSLQYHPPMGMTYLVVALPAQSIAPHGWFLVARSAYNGAATADQIQTNFLMGLNGGTLFLVDGTSALGGSCSTSASIIDKVGYGGGACAEGTGVPAPGTNQSIVRNPGGSCGNGRDTNNNSADFQGLAVSIPRNRFSPPQP